VVFMQCIGTTWCLAFLIRPRRRQNAKLIKGTVPVNRKIVVDRVLMRLSG
jgi:hypothetical protein